MPALQKQDSVAGLPDCPPVLFLIFNRPDKAQTVFNRIREAKPNQLFVAADGPRLDKPGEDQLCRQTRETILELIDWPCEVKTLFREKNLGCKLAVSSAITWFFEQVEEGIILEDDCLPSLSFFQFCKELLEKYRNNELVMMISGNNFQPEERGNASYYFSIFTHIWGWATWRRAWNHYDLNMQDWPAVRDGKTLYRLLLPDTVKRAEHVFEICFCGTTSTWDFQWLFTCLVHHGLSIMPNTNLVTNIDSGGTHMKVYDPYVHLPSGSVKFPLRHPLEIRSDKTADLYTQRNVYFRGWKRLIELIGIYLWRNAIMNPANAPSAIRSLCGNFRTEIRQRLASHSKKRRAHTLIAGKMKS